MKKYWKEYKWSNIRAMTQNNKLPPKECTEKFQGGLVIITGATSGIGYHTAKLFAAQGANLLFINRNEDKSRMLCEEISNEFPVDCRYEIADFTHIAEIHNVATKILALNQEISVFIHNAGVYNTKRRLTDDGNEMVFQVNYLGSFILNFLLKDKFKAQGNIRILFVNSEGHRFAISGLRWNDLDWNARRYSGLKGYGAAKVAQLLSTIKFADYFANSSVTINAMHPGNVKTNMGNNNGRIYRFFKRLFVDPSSKSPEISAKALYYLGTSKDVAEISGKFFNLTNEELPAPPALDVEAAEKLWEISQKLGRLEENAIEIKR